ncbi:hypothetical protein PN836_002385 [Ningiella sp. W23]|uniref:hypothetical protein n=1 Tax=Ningiella sp. W23 TaxID=3023715 RepID=UPI0037574B50
MDFLHVVYDDCKHEKLVVFSCKRRGFCPSCALDVWLRVPIYWSMMYLKDI